MARSTPTIKRNIVSKFLAYTNELSLVVIERIIDALAAGPVDTLHLIAASARTGPRARGYIHHLAGSGRIYQFAPPDKRSGNHRAALWALVSAFVEPVPQDEVIDTGDDFPRRVVVRQQWTPHHVRMAMDCLLFGVPVVMQGAAA